MSKEKDVTKQEDKEVAITKETKVVKAKPKKE